MKKFGASDRLDYASVLFRQLDRIGISTQCCFEEYLTQRGSVGVAPQDKMKGVTSQVLLLETMLYPFLSKQYFERVRAFKERLRKVPEWQPNGIFHYSQKILQLLVLEAYSQGFLLKKTVDLEDSEEVEAVEE